MRAPVATMRPLLAVALLFAALTAPGATAHINNFADTKTLDLAGLFYAQIDPQPQPIFANETTLFTVYLTSQRTGSYVTDLESVRLTFEANGTSLDVPLEPTANDSLAGNVTFPHRGNYTATLRVDDGSGGTDATTWMNVFPDLGFIVAPIEEFVDPERNRTTAFSVRTIDPDTGQRVAVATDMRFRVQHWDDAHTRVLRTYEVELMPQKDGSFRFEHVFNATGQYHLYIGSTSAAVGYDDLPMLHVFVNDPLPEDPALARQTPLGLAILLAGLAVASLIRSRP